MSGDVFGGIQDLRLEKNVGKNATLTVDGHAIFDNDDYDVKIDLSQPGLGYIRGGYTEFRSWYDGNGGFSPADGTWFSPRNSDSRSIAALRGSNSVCARPTGLKSRSTIRTNFVMATKIQPAGATRT